MYSMVPTELTKNSQTKTSTWDFDFDFLSVSAWKMVVDRVDTWDQWEVSLEYLPTYPPSISSLAVASYSIACDHARRR